MPIERRPFGRTGHASSAVIFGAAALKDCDQATADRTLELLLAYGVNHIDTAPRYGDSELRIGPWMERHRDRFFLASKTDRRDRDGALEQLHRSLERLRTDRLDLWQLHALTHPDEWERALAPGGAIDAMLEARAAGLVRFLGVTGHGWQIAALHRRALERFPFDSILLPWNWLCAQHATYAADFERVRALARARGVAVQTIKALARGPWAAGAVRGRTTWYQPLEAPEDVRLAVHWVLAQEGLFLNSTGDLGLLPLLLETVADPGPRPDDGTMAGLAERTGLATIFGLA